MAAAGSRWINPSPNRPMTDLLSPPAPPRIAGLGWALGTVRAQRRMWTEAGCLWLRRPLPSVAYARRLGEGQRFTLQRGSWMSVLVPMVVFSQFVDLLIAQGVIHVAAAADRRVMLHGLLLLVSLWSLVWAVALRSATRRIDHLLDPHALTLAVGFKHLCRLPLAAIGEVRRIDHKGSVSGKDWLARCGLRAGEVTVLSALDPPTLLIALNAEHAGAWWTCNGSPRSLKRWIAVYVDKPDAMHAAVAAALPAVGASAETSPQGRM
jgi:hypothetical protein